MDSNDRTTPRALRVPRRLRKPLVLLGALLVAAVLAEIAVRSLLPRPSFIRHMELDAELGFRTMAGLELGFRDERGEAPWVLNEHGFRGPALPDADQPPDEDTTRLLFVGDSFLMAWGIREEERMPVATVARLSERGVSAEAYTLANDGYGTAQELILLRRYGRRVRPDVVVLALFASNDIINNTLELAGKTDRRDLDYLRPYFIPAGSGDSLRSTWIHPVRAFLRNRSQLFAHAELELYVRQRRDAYGRMLAWPTPLGSLEERAASGVLPSDSLRFLQARSEGVEADAVVEIAWTRTETLLEAFHTEVEALGARLLVVVIPHHYQVLHGGRFLQLDANHQEWGGRPLGETLAWNQPETRLLERLGALGIEVLPLLEALRAGAAADPLRTGYLPRDGHLDGHGHMLAGATIADWLVEPGAMRGASAGELTAPVDFFQARGDAAARVDFREQPLWEHAVDGCVEWSAEWFGGEGGWALKELNGRVANVAVSVFEGPLVLEGELPPDATVPAKVLMAVHGGSGHARKTLEAPGPFTLELDYDIPAEELGKPRLVGIFCDSSFTLPSGKTADLIVHSLASGGR